ncbi:hypothetical protein B0H67DRAFT_174198 [Lasiosphaeris hirsuta]|uniref:Uncharacterized protein n=1 Tax=Lasiosphaeris hirsuta TaxID=260670 RepID=A0AA40AQF3_9PEZI|nr:hypothetical protein B0H67DRAFT_174198 [Lasiosphaeris hirsuta]
MFNRDLSQESEGKAFTQRRSRSLSPQRDTYIPPVLALSRRWGPTNQLYIGAIINSQKDFVSFRFSHVHSNTHFGLFVEFVFHFISTPGHP